MRNILLILLFAMAACQNYQPEEILAGAEKLSPHPNKENCRATVYIFFQPDCPLSQNQTLTVSEIAENPKFSTVCFKAVFTGKMYEREEITDFLQSYPVPYPAFADFDLALAHHLKARVVPEVFVFDAQQNLKYRGAIDDWAVREGSKRDTPSADYLKNALTAILAGKTPSPKETKAVGCVIE